MKNIKTYKKVNEKEASSFRISKMEEHYLQFLGEPDVPHRHDYYTVILVKEAEGTHTIDFNEYPLQNHQVFFVSPGQVHQIIENKESKGYSMLFSSQFLVENNIPLCFLEDLNLFYNYGQNPPISLNKEDLNQLLSYCKAIENYHSSNQKFKQDAIGAFIKLFLIFCNHLATNSSDNLQQIEAGNTILKGFKELVEYNYKTWHSTSQYASELNITPDHLNRSIKSLIGKTAKEYIQARITISAKRMLYFSNLSTKEIAYDLGFSEPANFSNFFKKCTGISPSEFKKSH